MIKNKSFESNEYTMMEKNILNEGNSTKIPTLISAKLLNYQTDTISSQSSSIYSKSNQSLKSMKTNLNTDNKEILLNIDQLAFTNKCLILDDEDVTSQIKKQNDKNDSIA